MMELSDLKGVGPKRIELLNKLGIRSVEDLVDQFPRRYEDRSSPVEIAHLVEGENQLIRAKLNKLGRLVYLPGKRTIQKASVIDDSGKLELVWYNQRYSARNLRIGDSYYIYGRLSAGTGQMVNPLIAKEEETDFIGIIPVYPLTEGLHNNFRIKLSRQALDRVDFSGMEILEEGDLDKLDFQPIKASYESLHFPETMDQIRRAKYEMSFREWVIRLFVARQIRIDRLQLQGPRFEGLSLEPAYERLPFRLTGCQQRAVDEIIRDLLDRRPMNRLLQGDVGSGKTVVALLSAYFSLGNGYQAAMMAPTEVLAKQHYRAAKKLLEPLGFPVYLSVGSDSYSNRVAFDRASREEVALFIGTHTLFQERVEFSRLGLVIMDEQQRFGVLQRSRLQEKALRPNTLVLSATPIPRTLSLVEMGDLDYSVLDELPPGRKPIQTYLVDRSYEDRLIPFLRKELDQGHQVYIVCPRISQADSELDYWSVEEVYSRYKEALSPYRAEMLFGSMSAEDKEDRLRSFSAGESQILISTTVIEVGIDVPRATAMLICGADRFGLAQLHQLRGRIGRSRLQSYCILMVDRLTPQSKYRLKILEETNDGFEIAKRDLLLRGGGDRYGQAQHGMETDFFLSEIDRKATEDARRYLNENYLKGGLPAKANEGLNRRIREAYEAYRAFRLN